ncbi:MAG: sodium-dependent transporter, partial [Lachnospiraceae bacterium]|nr:sodium-dependent transporter [Lachnospiraceae bacterium]
LPNVFNHLPGGRVWGTLFFLFMVFAAFSTVLAVFENITGMCMDLFGWTRQKTCLINIPLMILLSLPCVLGFNVLSGFQPLGSGTGVLDLEDLIVSNFMLPLGSLVFVLFCVLKKGWGWENFLAEANQGKGLKLAKGLRWYMTIVLPIIIVVVFIMNLVK